MKKFIIPALGLVAVLSIFVFNVNLAFGQVQGLIDPSDTPASLAGATGNYGGSLRMAMTTIVNYFLFFLGLIATIMVIYGGFLYITSGGDDAQTEKGKNILLYAAIGIIIILISYALVNTLLGAGSQASPI